MGQKILISGLFEGFIKKIVVIFFLFVCCNSTFSATSINKIGTKSTGLIYSIYQGESSLWLAGENGLYQLRGNEVVAFPPEFFTAEKLDIEGVVEDQYGRVWVTTFGNGITVFNPLSMKIERIGIDTGLFSEHCFDIAIRQKTIAINCADAISKINIDTFEISNFEDFQGEKFKHISHIQIADNGDIWFLDNSRDLFQLKNEIINKTDLFGDKFLSYSIHTFFLDSESTIWFTTNNGLYKKERGSVSKIENPEGSSVFSIIAEYSQHDLLVFSDRFYIYKTKSDTFIPLNSISKIQNTKIEEVYSLVKTKNNSIVFYAPLVGLTTFNAFSLNTEELLSKNAHSLNIQSSFLKNNGKLLIAHNRNLSIVDLETNTVTSSIDSLGVNTALHHDTNSNELLVGIENQGLYRFKLDDSKIDELYTFNEGIISDVVGDRDTEIVFGIAGGKDPGLFIAGDNAATKILADIHVDSVLKNKEKRIFFTSRYKGLFELRATEAIKLSESSGFIQNCLIEDSKGVLWICTDGGGLGYYDENLKTTLFIDPKYTADSRHVRDLVEDTDGYLWVMTNNGLVRYDHYSSQSIQVGEEEGIRDIDFEITASIKLTNDRILVAGDTKNYIINTKLANAFLNKRLEQTTKAIFVELSVRSRDFHGLQHSTNKLLDSVKHDRPVEFLADEFLFNITFAADNFVDRKILGYQYRLLGLDDQWTDAKPHENTATFSTLPTGDYRFQLRIFDPKSKAEQPISSLKIRVMPPFWQTWQAYSLYILGTAILLFFGAKYRTYKLKKLNKRLEKTVADNTVDLAKSQNKLARLLNQKEKLYANASHELKTPLTLISGPIDNLDEMDLPGKAKQELVVIKRNSQRLMTIVEQILELSSADAQTLNKKIPYDIKQSIDVIVTSFQPLVQIKNLSLHLNNTITCHAVLVSDSLEKILSNLLLNAYKYTQANKSVYINASNTHSEFCLEVRDEGIGIKSEYVKTIFDRFTRLDNMPENNGSGLGLAVVQELVRSNGGEISVESTEEVGTTFRIVIPIVAASEVDDEIVSEPTTKLANDINSFFEEEAACILNTGELPTVLLVEDHQDMRSLLFRVLSPSYNCISAKDGFEAFEKAMECVPDLIITDLMMPNCDGFEFTDKIRSNEITSHIPIVMLTAKGDNNTKLIGWEHQVDEFMTKPFNAKALRVRIANLLLIRKSIAQKFGQTDTDENTNQIFRLNSSNFHSDRDKRFFQKFISWLETNYSKETVSRKDASSALAVSERQLNRKLNALTNYSFNELLRKFRMGKAITEIKSGKAISVVAYETGFATPSYFSNRFKEEYGMSPSLFLEKYSDSLKPSK
ncbi:hybrid sensor histidine kinase/response regulator transcription factor [Aliiglaciecola sp. M165]|uniref:hybrid sensor histidine kinase/response regulator transcription factor n=1 Tax=Aliiglaciecola sp. M165 TaxID=2593649 RepID=UPI0011810EF9|nr:hybrid sensor histidine kinase/response regulator transcription factor [Aliiglaciecola sp. M165]TRY29100.1 response regulator [Aliiglaciecola sp. M165]